jgi:hypothetical protein
VSTDNTEGLFKLLLLRDQEGESDGGEQFLIESWPELRDD